MTSQDGTHSGFRNVVGKFTSHTVQKPQNEKKQHSFHGESSLSRIILGVSAREKFEKHWRSGLSWPLPACVPRVRYSLSTVK
jgi:hypothetical protein